MTHQEKDAALSARGCVLIEDHGDFALVYPLGMGSKRAHDLASKTRAAAVIESWDWLNPDQQIAERIEIIQRVVAREFGTTVHDLCNGGRAEPLATARRVAMVIARILTPASSYAVGEAFHREHGTVIYAESSVSDQSEIDERFAARFGTIREACSAAISATREKGLNG